MTEDWLPALADAVVTSWREAGVRIAVVGVVALLLALGLRRFPAGTRRASAWALLVAALGWGLWRAASLTWLADDAFISFRYAEHLATGQGLVFNPGEKVEGYTNFLLVIALAAARVVGASLPHAALALDVTAFIALVVLAEALVRTVRPTEPAAIPWAGLAIASMRPFHVFATSGLETEVALALAAGGVLAWRRERPVAASLLLGLGALARPDHLLLAGATWLVAGLTARGPGRWRTLARLVAPGLALFTAWWLARWAYYGAFFPNTFYAKSGGGAYWAQGAVYVVHAALASGVVFAAPLLLVSPALARRGSGAWPLVLLALAVAGTHGLYVARVGGDFMEFRFLLPCLFFVVVAWGAVARDAEVAGGRLARSTALALAAVALAVMAQPTQPIKPREKKWNLSAEESFWPVESVFPLRLTHSGASYAFHLRDAFAGAPHKPRFAYGVIGLVGFYSGLPITDVFGLTSRVIAQQPLTKRGRPGHEKFATVEEMYAEGAVFSEAPRWPGTNETLRLSIAGRDFWLVRHDPELQAWAQQHGWRYPDFDALVRSAALEAASPAALEEARALYEKLLRGTPGAAARLALLQPEAVKARLRETAALEARDVAARLRQAEAFGLDDVVEALRKRVLLRVDFEDDARPGTVADALWPPSEGAREHQTPVQGQHGRRLLNTYVDRDATVGRADLPLPAGAWLDFLVGGGSECTRKHVALMDGEREVQRWCGTQSETLRPVGVSLEGLGAPRLELVDEDREAWGHLLLDDVVVTASPSS